MSEAELPELLQLVAGVEESFGRRYGDSIVELAASTAENIRRRGARFTQARPSRQNVFIGLLQQLALGGEVEKLFAAVNGFVDALASDYADTQLRQWAFGAVVDRVIGMVATGLEFEDPSIIHGAAILIEALQADSRANDALFGVAPIHARPSQILAGLTLAASRAGLASSNDKEVILSLLPSEYRFGGRRLGHRRGRR